MDKRFVKEETCVVSVIGHIPPGSLYSLPIDIVTEIKRNVPIHIISVNASAVITAPVNIADGARTFQFMQTLEFPDNVNTLARPELLVLNAGTETNYVALTNGMDMPLDIDIKSNNQMNYVCRVFIDANLVGAVSVVCTLTVKYRIR